METAQLSFNEREYNNHLHNELWTKEETMALAKLVKALIFDWDAISAHLHDKTPKMCRQRYDELVRYVQHTHTIDKREHHTMENEIVEYDSAARKKKRVRRTADQIERKFFCQIPSCNKGYGTLGALKIHLKRKHPVFFEKSKRRNTAAHDIAGFSSTSLSTNIDDARVAMQQLAQMGSLVNSGVDHFSSSKITLDQIATGSSHLSFPRCNQSSTTQPSPRTTSPVSETEYTAIATQHQDIMRKYVSVPPIVVSASNTTDCTLPGAGKGPLSPHNMINERLSGTVPPIIGTMKRPLQSYQLDLQKLAIGEFELDTSQGPLFANFNMERNCFEWLCSYNGTKRKIVTNFSSVEGFGLEHTPECGMYIFTVQMSAPPHQYKLNISAEWERCSDFTSDCANSYKRHSLWLRKGVLEEVLEELLESDGRLRNLAQYGLPALPNPYFMDPNLSGQTTTKHNTTYKTTLKATSV